MVPLKILLTVWVCTASPRAKPMKVLNYLLALVESLAAVLLEILVSFFLGWTCSRCSRSGSGGADSRCSMSELPPLVLGLSSTLCTSLDILALSWRSKVRGHAQVSQESTWWGCSRIKVKDTPPHRKNGLCCTVVIIEKEVTTKFETTGTPSSPRVCRNRWGGAISVMWGVKNVNHLSKESMGQGVYIGLSSSWTILKYDLCQTPTVSEYMNTPDAFSHKCLGFCKFGIYKDTFMWHILPKTR